MSNIKVKTKDIPFVYTKGANINAAYGPWNSLEAAIVAAEEIYSFTDPITESKTVSIPNGLTVGVFENLTLKEYWYNGETFNEKLAGKSEYLLVFLYNGIQVDFITLNMDLITINRIQASTQVYTGTLKYKKDNAQDWTNVPSTNSISLTDVRNSIEVKWEDSSNELCKKSAVVLSTTEMKFLKFYAYTKTAPSINSANYLSDDWNPGESWTKNRQSLSIENPIEWGFERYKYNNVWQPYTGPTITGLRGSDGMSVYGKEFIYACSDKYDNTKSILSDEILVINTLVELLPDDAENGIYFDPSKHPLTTVEHIWYTKLPEISITNRYIFASERTKTGQQEDDFSAWTEPVLVYNFSIGLDGAFTEYLFCNFPNEVLYNSTEWNNISSDINKINSSSYVTNLDLEVAGKPFDSDISALLGLIYNWKLNAKGVSGTNKYEYCIYRKVSCDKFGIKNFGEISIQESPIIWSAFGKEGNDGKGIEYIYILTSTSTPPTIFQLNSTGFDPTNETDYVGKYWHNDEFVPYTDSTKTSRWYDNPQEVTHEYLYLWAAHRKGSEGDWAEFSEPVIWNKYHANYEIFLSNDNATIPASKEGTYTREAAKAATRTEVIVKLGNEEIDYTSEESPITVECEGYEQTGKIWQLTDTTLEFDKGTYLSNFVAKLNNEVVAHKAQSVHLNTNGDSYKLFVTPNSRQWYGGTEYSTENFEFSLYKIDSTGVMTEVQDTSGFKLILQHAGSPSITEMPYTLHLYNFEEGTYHDILITLAQNGKALDKETIDTIDLSSFVDPSQSNAIRISLSNDSPSIPDKDKDDATAVQSHTLVKVQAFSAREAIAITNVTMAANYVSDQTDNIEAHVEAVAGSNNLIYNTWIEFKSGEPQEIKDDILVTLTVKITNGDNEIVDYIVGYRIDLLNASENFVNFQVYPNILTTSSGNQEFDVDNLTFVTLKNFETIYPETINFTFYGLENAITGKLVYSNSAYSWYVYDPNYENNAGYRPISGLNYFSPGNLGEDYTKSSSFLFSISEGEVGKLQVKYQSVEVFFLKYNTVETYDVNLTNSYVTILKGTTDTNILNSLLASSYSIYKGTSSISPSSITYKLDNGSNLGWADLLSAVANITSTLLIHHITYNFTLSNGIVLQKTQTIEIVDRATYKLLCNPTTIIKSSSLSQNVTISVNKYSTSQVITLTGNQLSAEDLYVFVNNTLATISNNQVNVTYLGTDTSVTIELKKLTSQSSYRTEDCESLAIIVEGAKGDTPIQLFKWSATVPSTPTVTALDWSGAGPFDGWYKYVPTRTTGLLYMSQNILQGNGTLASNWSTPVSISGKDGEPGTDADNIEWIYNYSSSDYNADVGEKNPSGQAGNGDNNKNQDGWVPHNWYNHALAVSNANPTVYASYRKITDTSASKTYGEFSDPIVWSHWGLNGIDGDGVLYVYKLYASALSTQQEESYIPIKGTQLPSGEWSASNSLSDLTGGNWLDNAPSTTSETPYCYCSVIKRTNSAWGLFGKLSLWSKWSRDGASITKASADTYRYAIGTSGTTPPSSGWSTTKPSTFDLNKWLWTETTIHWSDNTTTVLYSADRNPNDGIDGQSVTITSQSVTYSKQTTGNLDPTTLTYGAYPSSIAKGDWIYSKTTVNYSDGTHTDAYSLSYSGTDGDSGRGISTIVEQYAVNNDKNNAPESSSFSTTFPSSWGVNNKYIWNREVITYTKGSPLTETTTPQIKAIWTKDGKGIDSIVNRYLTNNVASGITKQNYKSYNNGNEWPTAITPTTESNPYLWNFEVITYTDSTSEMTDPHVIGHFGKDGVDGQDGKDGVTIRTFKGTFEEDDNIVFRNDSGLTGSKKKWDATTNTWVDDTDPVLYKDYYLDITDDERKIAYVCKLTYVVKPHTVSDVHYIGYSTLTDEHGNLISVQKGDVWDVAQDLGNAFFTSLYALSGNIELLSSSVLKVNGRLLMQKDVGLGNYEVIGGINGEEGNDQTVVDPTLAFWSGGTGQKNADGKIDATFYVTKDGEFHGKEGVFNGNYEPIAKELESKNNIALKIDPRFISADQDDDDNYYMDIPVNFKNFGYTTIIKISDAEPARKINWFRYGGTVDNPNKEYIISNACFVDLPHVALLETSAGLTDSNLLTGFFNLFSGDPSNLYPTIHRWYKNIYDINIDNIDSWQYNISIITHFHDLMLKRYDDAKKYIGREILVSGTGTLYGVLDVVRTVDSPSNMRKWYTTPNYEYNPVDILSHFILTDINLGSYDLSLSLQPSITYTLLCVCKNITWESHTIPLIFWVAYKMHKTPYANSASADEEMLSLDIQQVSDNNQENS